MSDVYLPLDAAYARASQMEAFRTHVERAHGVSASDFRSLHEWAIADVGRFWKTFLAWADLPVSGDVDPPCVGEEIATARFFPRLRLNYAECLLRPLPGVPDDGRAVIARDEQGRRIELSRAELRSRVASIASALRTLGVVPGDRVVAVARNGAEAIEACLASSLVGAAWASVGPDLGTEAVLSRFEQLEPRVLFVSSSQVTHGVRRDLTERIIALVARLPALRAVVLLDEDAPSAGHPDSAVEFVRLDDMRRAPPLAWSALERFEFDHPLFILFSSGTTGAPKCIVHGAGGTLLEHLKEHRLHSDFGPNDLLYFHTSCGWMMWNWQLSALASGMPFMLFDGSVSYPDATALLRILDGEGVSVFGTSPAYIQLLKESGVVPGSVGPFRALRALQNTGSILYDDQFDWIRDNFKHVPIHSISGGTDIIGCFVLGNPLLPVFRGESQSVSLGLDVRVLTERGVEVSGAGELVCVKPFPSRPVRIWNDPSGERFHASYFAENAGLWTHGDRVEIKERGSARILGRSDGTMKIRGVRIGPAEIYSIVLRVPGVREAMAVEQLDPREPGGTRIVLFVVLDAGKTLDRPLTLRIKRELSEKASPVHVPAAIHQVSGLPQTLNGKFSEKAARDVVNARPLTNRAALRNPEVLDEIAAAVRGRPG